MKNYYKILGISSNMSEDEIYKAYNQKISQFNHLPFHTAKMIEEIKLLKEAIYVLGDSIKKNKYDTKMAKLQQYEEAGVNFDNTKICNRLFSITF